MSEFTSKSPKTVQDQLYGENTFCSDKRTLSSNRIPKRQGNKIIRKRNNLKKLMDMKRSNSNHKAVNN